MSTESYRKYGVWITEPDGSNGRWLMVNLNVNATVWQGSLSEAREHVDRRVHVFTDARYKIREYRDLAETHEEVKQLRDRNAVLEKIAAATVHYRETANRPGIYSATQHRMARETLDRLLLVFEVAK